MWKKIQSILSALLIIAGLPMPGVGTAMAVNSEAMLVAATEKGNQSGKQGVSNDEDKGQGQGQGQVNDNGNNPSDGDGEKGPTGSWSLASEFLGYENGYTVFRYTLTTEGNPQAISHVSFKVPTCLIDDFEANPPSVTPTRMARWTRPASTMGL